MSFLLCIFFSFLSLFIVTNCCAQCVRTLCFAFPWKKRNGPVHVSTLCRWGAETSPLHPPKSGAVMCDVHFKQKDYLPTERMGGCHGFGWNLWLDFKIKAQKKQIFPNNQNSLYTVWPYYENLVPIIARYPPVHELINFLIIILYIFIMKPFTLFTQ